MKQTLLSCTALSPAMSVPIVLLNGWGVGDDVWRSLIPELQAFTDVIVIHVVYENDVDQLCKKIHQQLPVSSVLLGWSLGGMLATSIAANYPQSICGLITLASNARFVANESWIHAMSETTFAAFYAALADNADKTLRRFLSLVIQGDALIREQKRYLQSGAVTELRTDWPAGLRLLKKIDNQTDIRRVACPVLHCFGQQDQLVPVAAVNQIQSLNSQHRCHIIQDAGHLLHFPSVRLMPVLTPFLKALG
jgi:pimeloyl-ACP methyl ester esterase